MGLPHCVIKGKNNFNYLPTESNGMYFVCPEGQEISGGPAPRAYVSGTMADWHMKLGHPPVKLISDMIKFDSLSGMKLQNGGRAVKENCMCCAFGKQKRLPLTTNKSKKPTKILDLIHTDLMGPMQTLTAGRNAAYVLTFVDDASRYAWCYLLKTKSAAFECFQKWLTMVENQTDSKVKRLRSDNGGEFCSKEF
jgi:hypothetical protein